MKIGPHESKPATAPAAADRKSNNAPAAAGAAEPSAKVNLSPAASLLASDSADKADPAFDTAKVERIAQAIRDGKFSVNAEAIADKLIVNAEELLGRKLS